MRDKTPGSRQLYFTSDGLAFFDERSALQHAETLADKQVSTKTSDEIERELQECIDESASDFQDLFCIADDIAA